MTPGRLIGQLPKISPNPHLISDLISAQPYDSIDIRLIRSRLHLVLFKVRKSVIPILMLKHSSSDFPNDSQ